MNRFALRVLVCLVLVGLGPACAGSAADSEEESSAAVVEPIEGTELSRVILSDEAVTQLGIETATVGEQTVPYAAVLFSAEGGAYVYTVTEPRTFVRATIQIDHTTDGVAFLLEGLPPGTEVVTVGAIELFGTEFVFEEE